MYKHTAPISGVATARNQWVLTAGYDNRVILWDAKTRSPVNRVFHDHLANQCSFSPCGQFIATVSSDYSCRVWSFPEMKLKGVIQVHTDDVESIAFHPGKSILATCSRDKTILISKFDGTPVVHLKGHKADVISVEWSKNDTLISSSDDGTIRVWDSLTGNEIACIDLDNVETDTIVITPDGTIYAGNDNGEILIIKDGNVQTNPAHEAGIKRLVYDVERKMLVSLSYDRSMKLWQQENGNILNFHTAQLPAIVWPRSCAFLDEFNLVFATFGDSYAQYNISDRTWLLDHIKPTHGLNAVELSEQQLWGVGDAGIVYQDGHRVAEMGSLCNFLCDFKGILLTGGQMGTLFNARTGDVLYQHHSPLNCAYGNQHLCVIGTYTGEGIILKECNGQLRVTDVIKLHNNAIKGVALSEQFIFSVCADASAAFHLTSDLSCYKYVSEAHAKIANGCDGNQNGVFVSISRDLKLRIWKEHVAEVIDTPSTNSIKCVAFSNDSQYVAIGNYTGWVGIYDLNQREWIYWKRRSFSGISCIKSTENDFIFSTYEGRNEFLIQG